MARIGLIDEKRLALIPLSHQAAHEYCFHLHDLMASLLVEMERTRAGHVSFTLDTEEEAIRLGDSESVLDFLAESGRGDIERRAVINHIGIALYADMLHFVYGALIALERRKFTVALSLLRKPFKEGLVLAAAICADEHKFFQSLKENPRDAFDAAGQTPDDTISVLSGAFRASDISLVSPEFIQKLVFDRKNDLGFVNLFDKATHFVTKNKHAATEDYNINFIFKNPNDNDIYDMYHDISLVIHVLHLMQIEIYSRMSFAKGSYSKWLKFTTAGAFESLFKPRPKMVRLVNKLFGELMICPGCNAKVKLSKAAAPTFFILETLLCKECGMAHQFPLGWLLSRTED